MWVVSEGNAMFEVNSIGEVRVFIARFDDKYWENYQYLKFY